MDEIERVEAIHESIKRRLYDGSKLCMRKLIIELETGGNIR
jgi:hypothetical protein